MKFDKTNILNLNSELLKLKSNPQDMTVTIGQLDAIQLETVLNASTSIKHIQTIIFEAHAPVNDVLEFLAAFIKRYQLNYEFLHTDENQRVEILTYLHSVGLTDVIDDSDNKIRVNDATSTPAAHTFPPDNVTHVYNYAEEIEKLLPVPPSSPKNSDDDLIELHEENLSDNDFAYTASKRNSPDRFHHTTKKHRGDNPPAIDPPYNTPITTLKTLTHSQCGAAAKVHKAICSGDIEEVLLALTAVSEDQQKILLNENCHEEFEDYPSVLKLALRSEKFILIATLINLGANPFQLSGNGYTLLHDIVLDMQPEALKVFLANVNPGEQLSKFINTPFSSRAYYGYYALDIICLETTQCFKDYNEAIKIENHEIANSILEIVRQLLTHNAQSKLLNDAKCEINSILKIDSDYNFQDIWALITTIHSLHTSKEKLVTEDTTYQSHAAKLLSQEWLKQGMFSTTQAPHAVSDPQFASLSSLVASGAITQEEAEAQQELLESFQTAIPVKK